jgi:hypothetical protein
MANIWDDDKLEQNLKVLASLMGKKGSELEVDNDTGTIKVCESLSSALVVPTAVTDIDKFQKPLKALFKKAYESRGKVEGVTDELIGKAISGLRVLCYSYKNNERLALEQLLVQVLPGGLLALHEDYGKYTCLVFAQAYFIGEGSEGICMGLTLDWMIERMANNQYRPTLTHILDRFESMQNLQEKYASFAKLRLVKRIQELGEALDKEIQAKELKKIDGSQKVIGEQTGGQIFGTILKLLENDRENGPFFLTYENGKPHVIGLDLRNKQIDIFDANFGAFSFPDADKKVFLSFCDTMWEKCKPNGVYWWDIVQVTGILS